MCYIYSYIYFTMSGLKNKPPKPRKCADEDCDVTFTPRRPFQKYCSFKCEHKNKKVKPKKPIVYKPRKPIKKKPFVFKPKKPIRKKTPTDQDLLYIKNRDEMKAEQIKKEGGTFCEHCFEPGHVECHHLVYRSEKPKHEHLHNKLNLILLLPKCHAWFHKKKSRRNDLVRKRGLATLFGNDVLDK